MSTLEWAKILLIILLHIGIAFGIIVVLPIAVWSLIKTIFGK